VIRALLIVLAAIGGLFTAIFMVKAKQFSDQPFMMFPPENITSAIAMADAWPQTLQATGSLTASQGIHVSAEVAGTVAEISFASGQLVQKGDLLLTLDDTVEQAQLKAAAASSKLAEVNLRRAKELFASRTISQSEFDRAEATAAEASAQLEQIKATISKKQIRAPFSGTLGIRMVDLGEFLSTGTAIVSLQQLDPVYADFSLPQNQISAARPGYKVAIALDAYPDRTFKGAVAAINPGFDTATRTVRVRAELDNPEQLLRPGMFVSVRIAQPEPVEVVAIPATAINPQAFGNSIFVVKPAEQGEGKVVEQRFVRLGLRRGDFVQVLDNLDAGEEVATAGVFKLSDGRAVAVDNSRSIETSLNPKPDNA